MHGSILGSLDDFALFVRVADAGGFKAAARLTGIPQATISRRVARIEAQLGTRLLDRTTRRVSTTPAGLRFCDHARRMIEQAEAATAAVAELNAAPVGVLRVTAPLVLGQAFVSDIVAEYLAQHPKIQVKLDLTGRVVDIVHEGFDVAIRVGSLADTALSATPLAMAHRGLFASPDYLAQAPAIAHPDDLAGHALLAEGLSLEPRQLILTQAGMTASVVMRPRLASSDVVPRRAAARRGVGLAMLPRFSAAEDIAGGVLAEVLADWSLPPVAITALTPSARGAVPVTRLFLELLRARLRAI